MAHIVNLLAIRTFVPLLYYSRLLLFWQHFRRRIRKINQEFRIFFNFLTPHGQLKKGGHCDLLFLFLILVVKRHDIAASCFCVLIKHGVYRTVQQIVSAATYASAQQAEESSIFRFQTFFSHSFSSPAKVSKAFAKSPTTTFAPYASIRFTGSPKFSTANPSLSNSPCFSLCVRASEI